jgi:hypothetical protein
MLKFQCECRYCGFRWVKQVTEYAARTGDLDGIRCTNGSCNDRNVKVTELSKSGGDAFGYRFSPDFPKEDFSGPGYWGQYSD